MNSDLLVEKCNIACLTRFSIAGMMLTTTEAMIADIPKEKGEMGGMPGGIGGMGMGM